MCVIRGVNSDHYSRVDLFPRQFEEAFRIKRIGIFLLALETSASRRKFSSASSQTEGFSSLDVFALYCRDNSLRQITNHFVRKRIIKTVKTNCTLFFLLMGLWLNVVCKQPKTFCLMLLIKLMKSDKNGTHRCDLH